MLQLNQTCEKQKDPEVHFLLSLYREALATHHDQVLLSDQSPVTDYCSKILEKWLLNTIPIALPLSLGSKF